MKHTSEPARRAFASVADGDTEIDADDRPQIDAGDGARARFAAIAPLLRDDRTLSDVTARARACGRHPSTLYAWLAAYETGGRTLAALAPDRSDGGRGRSRLDPRAEAILRTSIAEASRDVTEPVAALVRRIAARCAAAGVPAPHGNTVRARLAATTAVGASLPERPANARLTALPEVPTTRADFQNPSRADGPHESPRAVGCQESPRAAQFQESARVLAPTAARTRDETTEPWLVVCALLTALATWAVGR